MGGAAARQRSHLGVRGARLPGLREPLPRGSLPPRPRLLRGPAALGQGSPAACRGPAGPAGGRALARAQGPRRPTRGRGPPARDGGRGPPGLAAARHGADGTALGYVVALTVEDRREGTRFVHASDVQGPLSPVAAAYLARQRPTLLYLSGPPAYLEHAARHRAHRPGHRAPAAHHRPDRLPRDLRSLTRCGTPRTRSASGGCGRPGGGDRGGLPRARRRAARGAAAELWPERRKPPMPVRRSRARGAAEAGGARPPARADVQSPAGYAAGEGRDEAMSEGKALAVGDPAPDFTLKTHRAPGREPQELPGQERGAAVLPARLDARLIHLHARLRSAHQGLRGGEYPGAGYQHGQPLQPRELGEVGRASRTTRCSPTSTAPPAGPTASTGRTGTPTCGRPS